MALLTFKISEVQRLIDHAKSATETIMSALPCVLLIGNPLDLYENEEEIEALENEWGIYLMSNGRPGPKDDDPDIDFFARPKEAATPETAELERERLFDMMVCHVPLNLNELEQALTSQSTNPDFHLIISPWAIRALPEKPTDEERWWAKSQPQDTEWQDRLSVPSSPPPTWEAYLAWLPAWAPMPEPPFKTMVHGSQSDTTH